MSQKEINQTRINNIINIIRKPKSDIRDLIPSSLLETSTTIGFLTDSYLILAFLTEDNLSNIKKYINQGLSPFPFLIKPQDVDAKYLVGINNAQYNSFVNTKFVNGYSFSLGKDSTFILHNHTVSVSTTNFGIIEYSIDLAYVIYFGDNINTTNVYDYLENLVLYSLNEWGSLQ